MRPPPYLGIDSSLLIYTCAISKTRRGRTPHRRCTAPTAGSSMQETSEPCACGQPSAHAWNRRTRHSRRLSWLASGPPNLEVRRDPWRGVRAKGQEHGGQEKRSRSCRLLSYVVTVIAGLVWLQHGPRRGERHLGDSQPAAPAASEVMCFGCGCSRCRSGHVQAWAWDGKAPKFESAASSRREDERAGCNKRRGAGTEIG